MPKLTLKLGIRYEYFQPIFEVNNKTGNYNPDTQPFEYAGGVPAGAAAGSTVCANQSCINPYYNNFMPRVGFAYQVNPKMVVRGGFAITKAMEGTGANLRLSYNAPFANSLEAAGTSPSTTTGGLFLQEKNGFTAPNGAADVGGFPRIEDPNVKPQQTNEYSLTTEYQLNNYSSVKVSYVGELSDHLIQARRPNQLPRPCIINTVVTDPNADPTGARRLTRLRSLTLLVRTGLSSRPSQRVRRTTTACRHSTANGATRASDFTVNYAYEHASANLPAFLE